MLAYLSVLANPPTRSSLRRIVNQPPRGIGDASVDRMAATARLRERLVWDALADPERRREHRGRRARCGFRALMDDCATALADCGGRPARDACSRAPASSRRSRPSARSRPRAVSRTSRSSSASRASTTRAARNRRSTGFLQEVALTADADALAADEDGSRHADDAAQREGPRVRGRLRDRAWSRTSSRTRAIEEANIEEERRLCYVAITRARRELSLVVRPPAHALRRARLRPAVAVHRRDPREPASSEAQGPQLRLGVARRPGLGSLPERGRHDAAAGDRRCRATRSPTLGRRQRRHDQLGEGVVTGTADGGQVIVRFRSDGSERRLLLAYAPLKRI